MAWLPSLRQMKRVPSSKFSISMTTETSLKATFSFSFCFLAFFSLLVSVYVWARRNRKRKESYNSATEISDKWFCRWSSRTYEDETSPISIRFQVHLNVLCTHVSRYWEKKHFYLSEHKWPCCPSARCVLFACHSINVIIVQSDQNVLLLFLLLPLVSASLHFTSTVKMMTHISPCN